MLSTCIYMYVHFSGEENDEHEEHVITIIRYLNFQENLLNMYSLT